MLWFGSISLGQNTATDQRSSIHTEYLQLATTAAIQLEMLLEAFTVTSSVLTAMFSSMKKALLHTHTTFSYCLFISDRERPELEVH